MTLPYWDVMSCGVDCERRKEGRRIAHVQLRRKTAGQQLQRRIVCRIPSTAKRVFDQNDVKSLVDRTQNGGEDADIGFSTGNHQG
ncbi:hypothetical protein N5C66_21160 [Rhizobium pusense]|nr:hypothetical protein [Agrobacterium pusense]MDH1097832.1 hypothetical protein [Agrobacterium pusense]MDH1114253.1 hypothetical protein [Agrobacterium pusense]MDH2196369.1 hypothetical protein [Agrobacterium pusense]